MYLLCATQDRLFATGQSAYALDLTDGGVAWRTSLLDGEAAEFGRGFVAGDRIYVPNSATTIAVLEQITGEIVSEIDLSTWGAKAGALAFDGKYLAVAAPQEIFLFGNFDRRLGHHSERIA